MSRRRVDQPKRGKTRKRLILIYGESENDTRAIASLIRGIAPGIDAIPTPRRQPMVLIRDAQLGQAMDRAQRIADAVAAESAIADVVCVFAHEDCDDFEPAHEGIADKIESHLRRCGCDGHAVAPAWELEAWWFLFPAAVSDVNRSWDSLEGYRGREIGKIRNAKEELQSALRSSFSPPQRKRIRTYRESDAPLVAHQIAILGLAHAPNAVSASYSRFVASVATCAAHCATNPNAA
jgi:hypothetical protein